MKKRWLAAICAIVIGSFGLCACEDVPSFLGTEEEAVPETVVVKEVRIPMEKVSTLNPAAAADEDTYYISKLVYEGLFALDETLAAVPVLAKSWDFDPDKKTLTLSLVPGVTWHDGEAFTAADVKFSIEVYMRNATLYASHVAGISSVKAADDATVVITYGDPVNAALENLTFPILPQHEFGNVSSAVKVEESFRPVGTGPYRVAEADMSSHVKLVGYEGYRGGGPDNTLMFKLLPEKENAVNLFNIYEYDMAVVKDVNREALLSNKEADTVSFLSNEAEVLGFNVGRAELQDARVRRAVALAVDTEELIDVCYYNSGAQNDTIYYPGYLGTPAEGDAYPWDPALAKSILIDAGLIDLNGDGYLENIGGSPFSLEILVNEENTLRVAAADLIRTGLLKAGVQSTVRALPYENYQAALIAGDYDVFLGGYSFGETYDLRNLLHSAADPVTNYANPALDLCLEQMQATADGAEKLQNFSQIQQILKDELPYYCLLYKTYGFVSADAFRGEKEAWFFDLYANAPAWSTERPAAQ